MFALYCLLLGVLQGAAEFLPISSSGHLALFEAFFPNAPELPGGATAFGVLLHLGTLAAVFIAYRRDLLPLPAALLSLIRRLFSKKRRKAELSKEERTCLLLLIGTLPLVVLKLSDLLLEKALGFSAVGALEIRVASQPIIVGAILIFNAALLFYTDRLRGKRSDARALTYKSALFIGVFQMFALLPGLSRSGATVAGGQFKGLGREEALRFSFLLSVPAVLGAAASELPSLSGASLPGGVLPLYAAAALVSFAVGLLCLRLLRKLAKSASFLPFSVYCWALGALAIIAGAVKLLAA